MSFKAFGNNGCQSNWSIVAQGADVCLLGHWDDGCCFKAGRNSSLHQRGVEDVGEYLCQLMSTVLEDLARDPVSFHLVYLQGK